MIDDSAALFRWVMVGAEGGKAKFLRFIFQHECVCKTQTDWLIYLLGREPDGTASCETCETPTQPEVRCGFLGSCLHPTSCMLIHNVYI